MPARGPKVLIVDDEAAIRQSLRGVLSDENYQCTAVESGETCLAELARESYEAVLLDIWMPGIDGLSTLARIQDLPAGSRPAVIMISGHGNIETAVKATKLGAFDFVEKPLTIEKVSVVVKNAVKQRRTDLELQRLRENTASPEIIGESVAMKALRQQLKLMAGTNGRVLIYGESGTGKELVARAIHKSSQRASGPFVEVNCAALPEDLIESELFGHRRTNLDGTADHKIGKLQKAHGGTFFLDEVGDMSLKTQAKVLRALDEHRFEPVGAPQSIQVDARVIAATNKNLEKEIERGNFREDLFYRLNVIPFTVPPAAGTSGGYTGACRSFPARLRTGLWPQTEGAERRRIGRADEVSMARKHPRASQSYGAHRHLASTTPDRSAPSPPGGRPQSAKR